MFWCCITGNKLGMFHWIFIVREKLWHTHEIVAYFESNSYIIYIEIYFFIYLDPCISLIFGKSMHIHEWPTQPWPLRGNGEKGQQGTCSQLPLIREIIMAQLKDTLVVRTDTDEFTMVGRSCELSAHSFVPTERSVPRERTYYNSEKQVSKLLTLDTKWLCHMAMQFHNQYPMGLSAHTTHSPIQLKTPMLGWTG